MQVVNAFLCRHATASIVTTPLFGNRLILAGVLAELGLLGVVVYTPIEQRVFETAPVGLAATLVLPFMLAMLLLEEGRKALVRRALGLRTTAGDVLHL